MLFRGICNINNNKTCQVMLLSYRITQNVSKNINTGFINGRQQNDWLLLRIALGKNYNGCRGLSSGKGSELKEKFARINEYMAKPQSASFEALYVEKIHKYDKKDPSEWALIYRDVDASKMSSAFSIFFPALSMVFLVLMVDIFTKDDPYDRLSITQRLAHDCLQLGILIVIPFTLIFMVITGLLRFNYLKPLRIYQSFSNPDNYIVVVPRLGRSHKQIKFSRCDSNGSVITQYTALDNFETLDNMEILRQLFYGNAMFANRKFLLNSKCWRSKEIKNYMFNKD
uniref:Transmembrane protein n=1 Tax=Strongyloides venezuelensis TaxID=75913 RepID=A0A0K0FMD2_STRVS